MTPTAQLSGTILIARLGEDDEKICQRIWNVYIDTPTPNHRIGVPHSIYIVVCALDGKDLE